MRQSSLHHFLVTSKRAAPSVDIDMESPDALKSYLDVEGIAHDGTMDIKH